MGSVASSASSAESCSAASLLSLAANSLTEDSLSRHISLAHTTHACSHRGLSSALPARSTLSTKLAPNLRCASHGVLAGPMDLLM